ncbi:MAG TPA: redox-regulated ATPase YchF [Candidatus Bathyarchaeia archaeon]|nr:redox-regulated ATPase YchF [Candidatus Bathyarchaeia archaeon]
MMVGIVGKPNTGKSTFFCAATLAPAEIANYPFTTIKPNRGIGYVRTPCACREFNVKDNPKNSICREGIRLIPVELIDCAGLVPGAWQGKGLGNQFLDEIRKADALIHIIDASGGTDAEGKICKPGERDPVEDVHFLEVELTMWLANILKRDWQKILRSVESEKQDFLQLLEERLSGLAIRRTQIFEAIRATGLNAEKPHTWGDSDFLKFVDKLRNVSKPMLIAANKIDLPCAEDNLERLKMPNYTMVPCCAEAELALRKSAEMKLTDYRPGDCNFKIINPHVLTQRQSKALETIKEKILEKFGTTGVQDAINTAYFKLLNSIVVYPVEDIEHLTDHEGRVLPDAYIVPYGTTARELAYRVHTELGQSFIYGIEAHEKKRVGEDYALKHGDVLSIVSAKKRT